MSIKVPCKNWTPGLNIEFKYAHLKRDGIYLRVNCNSRTIWTIKPTNITNDVRFVDSINRIFDRDNSNTFLGELFCTGKPASYVKTAIVEHSDKLRFEVFAVETAAENARLEIVRDFVEHRGGVFVPFFPLNDSPFILEDELSKFVDAEGWVLKNGNCLDFYKWKPVKTVDCIVTGFIAGKGKYLGMVGSLVVSLYCDATDGGIVEVASVGGFTDEERMALDESVLGKVVEVEYQYVGSGGRLRHPRFKMFRPDKSAHECTTEQDAAWSYLDE